MSLWVDGDKKNGKRPLYSIGPDPLTGMFCGMLVVVILLGLLAPVVQMLRNLLQ